MSETTSICELTAFFVALVALLLSMAVLWDMYTLHNDFNSAKRDEEVGHE